MSASFSKSFGASAAKKASPKMVSSAASKSSSTLAAPLVVRKRKRLFVVASVLAAGRVYDVVKARTNTRAANRWEVRENIKIPIHRDVLRFIDWTIAVILEINSLSFLFLYNKEGQEANKHKNMMLD
jgi:hypothetical protein